MFIVFEGGEGCGKTTQINLFYEKLKKDGYSVSELTREPGSPHLELNQGIRNLFLRHDFKKNISALAEVGLFLADRANHLANFVQPNLEQGKTVISSRGVGSTLVYQGYAQKILSMENLRLLNNIFTQGLKPDITFYLDVPVSETMKRLQNERQQTETYYDRATTDFHESVRRGFLELAQVELGWELIDGSGSIEEVAEEIWKMFQLISKK